MKKYGLLIAITALFWCTTSVFAYKQQWFTQFQEDQINGTVSFTCPNQCLLLMWDVNEWDIITVNWTIAWEGTIWYWYLVGNAVYPTTMLNIWASTEYKWVLSEHQMYAQIPKEWWTQVVILVQWKVTASNLSVSFDLKTIWDIWNSFWKVENIAPYSINLHYWPTWGSWSWPLFWTILALLITILSRIIATQTQHNKKTFWSIVVWSFIWIMIVWWGRLLVDYIKITHQESQKFVQVSENEKTVFDLHDYIYVTEQVRNKLKLDELDEWKSKKCTIYAESWQPRPFIPHWAFVYLRPCEVIQTWSIADFLLYYNKTPSIIGKSTLLTWTNFILFDNRK